jgi:hypothetical protein
VRKLVNVACVLHELLVFAIGIEDPRWQHGSAPLPFGSKICFDAASLILTPTAAVTRLITPGDAFVGWTWRHPENG